MNDHRTDWPSPSGTVNGQECRSLASDVEMARAPSFTGAPMPADPPIALLDGLAGRQRQPGHRPYPQIVVAEIDWMVLVDRLRHSDWTLLSMWAVPAPEPRAGTGRDSGQTRPAPQSARDVCVAIRDNQTGDVAVVSLAVPGHGVPSIARVRPLMALLEQAVEQRGRARVADPPDGIFGVRLHGDADAAAAIGSASLVVGPAAAGIGEPVRFLVDVAQDRIAGLGVDLGYTRRGIEDMLPGRMPAEAIRLVCRSTAQAPVAMAWAFAAAVEDAVGMQVSPRAVWLRALMSELERVGRHLRYCAGINADVGETALSDGWLILRECLLRACDGAFGHRMMMDAVVPGGVADDLADDSLRLLRMWLKETADEVARMVKAGGAGRAALGRLSGLAAVGGSVKTGSARPMRRDLGADPAVRIDLVGPVARAAGRLVDARLLYRYAPYDRLTFTVPNRCAGDALARLELRVAEIRQSLSLIRQLLAALPAGPVHDKLPAPSSRPTGDQSTEIERDETATAPSQLDPQGLALIESPDGEVLVAVRLDGQGRLRHVHLRDPSWLVWPLLPSVAAGAAVEDLALVRRSLAADVAAVDL